MIEIKWTHYNCGLTKQFSLGQRSNEYYFVLSWMMERIVLHTPLEFVVDSRDEDTIWMDFRKKKKKDTIWWWKGNPSNDEKHGSPLIDFLIICCLHCISIVSWILDFVYLIGPYCFHIMTFHPGMVIEWFFCGQTSVFPSFGATFFIHHSVDPAMMDCIEILFLGVTIDSLHCILCDAWLFSIFVTGPKT